MLAAADAAERAGIAAARVVACSQLKSRLGRLGIAGIQKRDGPRGRPVGRRRDLQPHRRGCVAGLVAAGLKPNDRVHRTRAADTGWRVDEEFEHHRTVNRSRLGQLRMDRGSDLGDRHLFDGGTLARRGRDDRGLPLPDLALRGVRRLVEMPALHRHKLDDQRPGRRSGGGRPAKGGPYPGVRPLRLILDDLGSTTGTRRRRCRRPHGRSGERDRLRRQAGGVLAELQAHGAPYFSRSHLERCPPRDRAGVLLDHEPLPSGHIVDRSRLGSRIGGKRPRHLPRRCGIHLDLRSDRTAWLLRDRIEVPAVLELRGDRQDVGLARVAGLDHSGHRHRVAKGRRDRGQRVVSFFGGKSAAASQIENARRGHEDSRESPRNDRTNPGAAKVSHAIRRRE